LLTNEYIKRELIISIIIKYILMATA
jgi:hypothetical protein